MNSKKKQHTRQNNNTNLSPQERYMQIINQAKQLVRDLLQEALNGEFDYFMDYPKYSRDNDKDNYRNGSIPKTIKTSMGEMQINTPRDRNSKFEPHMIPKRKTMFDDLADKVLSLYSKGMSTSDIVDELKDIYGDSVNTSLISRITNRIMPMVEEWRSRPLSRVYAIVYIDCLFYKVREEGQVKTKAVYVVLGINENGEKEILGFWINATESASFWYKVLNDLKSRGVEDMLIVSVDNLKGIDKAIKGVYPKAEIQKCVVHQVRSSLKHIPWKEKKEFANDLKGVYKSETEELARERFEGFKEKWGEKYWYVIKSWEENWQELMEYYRYPHEMRRLIYTTNAIESLNSMFRKVTKGKKVFPSDESLSKSLYLAIVGIEKKWTGKKMKSWGIIYGQLKQIFEGRI